VRPRVPSPSRGWPARGPGIALDVVSSVRFERAAPPFEPGEARPSQDGARSERGQGGDGEHVLERELARPVIPSPVPRPTRYSKRWIDTPGPDDGASTAVPNRWVVADRRASPQLPPLERAPIAPRTRRRLATRRRGQAGGLEPQSENRRLTRPAAGDPDIHHLRCGERDRAADGGTSELSHCPLALGQRIVRSVTSGQRPGACAAVCSIIG
jgi:hypothetical protein